MKREVGFDPALDAHLDRLKQLLRRRIPMSTLKEKIKMLPATRRKKVEKRAKRLVAEEISLRNFARNAIDSSACDGLVGKRLTY